MFVTMNPVIRDIALEMGHPPYQIRKWKLREEVPHKHRLPILEVALARGESLKASDFEFATAKSRKAKPRAKSAPSRRRKAA